MRTQVISPPERVNVSDREQGRLNPRSPVGRALWALCLIGLLCACSTTNKLVGSKATLWNVKGDHNTMYLLGSVHVLSKHAYPLKPALVLETLRDQAQIFDSFNDKENELYLVSTISGLPAYAVMVRRLVDAWKDGDVRLLDQLLNQDKRSDPTTHDVLFSKRNSKWMPEIERFAHENGNYLIIVGAGHLVGDDGVIAQLKRAGYAVQQL